MARRGLGSTEAAHKDHAAYYLNSLNHTVKRGLVDMRQGDCKRALNELLAARQQAGQYLAHAESAGIKRPSLNTLNVTEFEVGFGRACPVGVREDLHGARRRRRR